MASSVENQKSLRLLESRRHRFQPRAYVCKATSPRWLVPTSKSFLCPGSSSNTLAWFTDLASLSSLIDCVCKASPRRKHTSVLLWPHAGFFLLVPASCRERPFSVLSGGADPLFGILGNCSACAFDSYESSPVMSKPQFLNSKTALGVRFFVKVSSLSLEISQRPSQDLYHDTTDFQGLQISECVSNSLHFLGEKRPHVFAHG